MSLDDLAAAMGISKSAVFYHYKRKAEILADVVRPLLDGVDELMVEHRGDPEAMFEAYVALVDERRIAVEVLSSDVASVMSTELGPRIRSQYRSLVRAVAGGRQSVRAQMQAASALATARLLAGRTFVGARRQDVRREVLRAGRAALRS